MECLQTFRRYSWWTTTSFESYDMRDEDICAGIGDRRAELQLFHSSSSGLKLPQRHHAQHWELPTPTLATMLCSSICSGHKMVPGILMHQTYHLESTWARESLSYTPVNMKEEVCRRCTCSRFSLPAHQSKTLLAHAFTCLCIYCNWNRTFSNWGRKENKICLLSTQEKLMNSCKSTPKSKCWVWLSMVQKMSGILIESRLSHVFMLTAFITVTTRAKLMLPCCLMKYINLSSSIN